MQYHLEKTTTQIMPPVLGQYTDYRAYLKDFYDYKRRETAQSLRPYSYGTFAAAADIRSPNYLKLIIEGARNLSREMANKFSKAMGHSREEIEEFELLVVYSQAKDPLERNRHLKALNDFRVKKQLKSGHINNEGFDKVSSWVTWVLYALADQQNANFGEDRLFALLKGKASIDEIRKALKKLLADGDLIQDPITGQVKKGRLLMAGAEEIPVALVRKIQAELIYLGLESLFHDEPQDREFGAMTIAMTEKEFEGLKFELRQLRKRLFKDFSVNREQAKGDRVFQLNIQLFPLTKES